MEEEVMVHKANQIAVYFSSYPEEQAVAGVADHLLKFWEPRMRRQIIEYAEGGGAGLSELALAAVQRIAKPTAAP